MKVSELMTSKVVTISPNETSGKAQIMMRERKIHHLIVVEDEKVVGVLSSNDFRLIINPLANAGELKKDLNEIKIHNIYHVRDLMTPDPVAVTPEEELSTVAEKMLTGKFHSVPVTQGDRLLGIITQTDILKAVAQGRLQ